MEGAGLTEILEFLDSLPDDEDVIVQIPEGGEPVE